MRQMKITFSSEITWQSPKKLPAWDWVLIWRHCYYVSSHWSKDPGFYWTILGSRDINRNNHNHIFWNWIRESWYVIKISILAASVKEEFCFAHLFGKVKTFSQILTIFLCCEYFCGYQFQRTTHFKQEYLTNTSEWNCKSDSIFFSNIFFFSWRGYMWRGYIAKRLGLGKGSAFRKKFWEWKIIRLAIDIAKP